MTMSTTAHQTKTRKSGSAGGGGKKEHGGSGGSGASTAGDQTNNNKRKSPGGGGGKEGHGAGGASSSSSFSNKKKSKPSSSTTATSTAAATKRQLKHERQSTRKHADIVQEAKSIWNQLRLKTNTKDDTQKLTDQLMKLIMTTSSNNTSTDKKMIVTEIALQHDASRCVQAAIQFGTTQQRRLIVTELTATPGNLAELSKSLYAQFVVLKMIQYCCKDDVCVTKMTRNIKGHLVKMATHAVASKVVESLFNKLTSKQMAVLKQEFYGPQFSLFATASSNDVQTTSATKSSITSHAANNKKIPDLEANLILAPEKTTVTLEFVLRFVHTCMEKSLYGYEYFQTLLSEYCTMASPVELRQLVSGTTVAHNAIHLLASRSGTRALSYLIAYATAKDRKAMLKSIKGYARSGLLHKDAYLAIIRLVQLTDDTVVVQKNLLQELITTPTKNSKDNVIVKDKDKGKNKKTGQHEQEQTQEQTQEQDSPLLEICTSETGSKLFLMLLPTNPETDNGAAAAAWRKYFDPYELSVLFENPTIPSSGGGGGESTSKKSPTIKRQELLDNCLREPLVQLCCQHAEELLRSRPGCAVLREVYQDASSSSSSSQSAAELIVRAVVDACEASLKDGGAVEENEDVEDAAPMPLLEDRIGHLAIKNLLLLDAANTSKSDGAELVSSLFATQFLDRLGGRLMDIAQANRGAFVVAALCKVPSVRKSAFCKLDRKRLEELSKQENVPTAGFEALLKEIKSV